MSWSKQELIAQAMLEIGLSAEFNIEPEEYEAALRSLDSMMATWSAKGVGVGYLLANSPELSDISSDSGVASYAIEAVYLNLAPRLAPRYGKTVSQNTLVSAKQAYDLVLLKSVFPNPQPMPNTMPRGAGNRPWLYSRPFYPTPEDVTDPYGNGPVPS